MKGRRRALIKKLGGKCVKCGSRSRLEFDHPNGRDWQPRDHNQRTRIARYEREADAGDLQLKCRKCNAGFNPHRDLGPKPS